MQLERLRVCNTKLVDERDAAVELANKAEEAVIARAYEEEVARVCSQKRLIQLTTTTQQQGKLIDHLCSLLPPEHKPSNLGGTFHITAGGSSTASSASSNSAGGFVRSSSRWFGGNQNTNAKSTGHSAFFAKTKSILLGKKAATSSKLTLTKNR